MSRMFIVAVAATFTLCAAQPSQADTLRNGFSVERLARADQLLDAYVADGRLAGIVALVLRDGKPVYEHAVGWADKEAGRKMTMDTEFRIASQSKALTSVAVLQLMEEGKLTLNDPAGKWIPTFANTSVGVKNENGTGLTMAAAKRPINLKDLLTHTAGINYGTSPEVAALYEAKGLGPAAGYGWYFADKDEPICDAMRTARYSALRGAAGRCLRLRLQHRHSRLHRREGIRACRSMSSSAATSPGRWA